MGGKIAICRAEATVEVVLPCLDSTFTGDDTMVVWFHELVQAALFLQKFLYNLSPFGMVILTGLYVGLMFVTGAPVMTKFPVVPESPIAMPFGMGLLGAALCAKSVLVARFSLESVVARLLLAVFEVTTVTSSS